MTAVNPDASRQAAVESALVLLERMGVSPADLAAVPQPRKTVPTFAEYVLCGPRTLSTSCDQAVFVDHATDASVSPDVVSVKIDRFG